MESGVQMGNCHRYKKVIYSVLLLLPLASPLQTLKSSAIFMLILDKL
ncbi:hypothetical protein L2719_05435 [Shewanella schlegeliana]|uniref:Uncharacterized protein n=1 Tax=Shewanella schlegeliana TaxID=190308 RepID=A0ABS1SWJ8_9GAMM|nr:hypothetical protein [Shewanella schlegeliana]MBL4912913.1 hypothetical protein [Shewanella schlegeliana]MCL1108991.1 hypothetical protein [Shewanella schlegeliana]